MIGEFPLYMAPNCSQFSACSTCMLHKVLKNDQKINKLWEEKSLYNPECDAMRCDVGVFTGPHEWRKANYKISIYSYWYVICIAITMNSSIEHYQKRGEGGGRLIEQAKKEQLKCE